MKICLVAMIDLSTQNGGTTHTLEFAENWANSGHDVFLFSRGLRKNALPFHYVNVPFIRLKGLSSLGLSLFLAAKMVLYHARYKFDVIYHRYERLDPVALVACLLHIPLVTELNDLMILNLEEISKEPMLFKRWLLVIMQVIFRFNRKLVINKSAKFVATTQAVKKVQKKYGIPDSEVYYLPFGANTELFKPADKTGCRQALKLAEANKVVCFVGNFYPWQGLEDIIEALPSILKNVPEAMLLVVGDQPPHSENNLKQKLLDMIKGLHLESKVIFTDSVPYQDVPVYINAADVCVIAQRPMRAGFSPLKLFEYMACGKPVVASDIAGVREIVEESQGGILIPPENEEKLAEALIDLLVHEELMREMGENGRRCVNEEYTWKNMACRAAEVCEKAIDKRRQKMSEL